MFLPRAIESVAILTYGILTYCSFYYGKQQTPFSPFRIQSHDIYLLGSSENVKKLLRCE